MTLKLALPFFFAAALLAQPSFSEQSNGRAADTDVVRTLTVDAGDLLVVAAISDTSGTGTTVVSVADNQSNTWTAIGTKCNNSVNNGVQLWYTIAGTSASTAVTITLSANGVHGVLIEYNGGVGSILDEGCASGTASPAVSATMDFTATNALIVAVAAANNTLTQSVGTNRIDDSCPQACVEAADLVQSTGSYTIEWTHPGSRFWSIHAAAFGTSTAVTRKKVITF